MQVCPNADALRTSWELAGKIGGHGARAACGETHVIYHAAPFPVGSECFHVWSDGFDTCLIRCIHSRCGKVFDLTVKQQPEWATVVRFAKVEFQAVQLGEAFERSELEIANITVCEQIG